MTISGDEQRIDPSDPYYIHPSDHPGMVLVTPPFDGRNFGEWRRSVRIALSAKNKIGFVNGEIPKPSATSPKLRGWDRCNDMVISWIINSLSVEIRQSVIYTDTAQAIWSELESRFSKLGGTQLYAIQNELSLLEQGANAFPVYFTQMKALWDELDSIRNLPACTCGSVKELLKYEEDQRVVQLLMGLNESFTTARGSILMMKPFPSINLTYSLLVQEENQREIKPGNLNVDNAALLAKTQGLLNQKGLLNQSFFKGGQQSNGGKGNSEKKPLYCTNCKKSNQTVDRCFFIIHY